MINCVLTDLAKEIGYSNETIEYANMLTYKTLSICLNEYDRYIFVASLHISARMKKNEIIDVKKLLSIYEVSDRLLLKYKIKVLNANDISYCGAFQYETKKTHEIPKQSSFFDDFE